MEDPNSSPEPLPSTAEETNTESDEGSETDAATPDAVEEQQPTEEAPIAPTYEREHPQHGSIGPQSIYRFNDEGGAIVTRFRDTGKKVVQEVRFLGVEVTNFANRGEALVMDLEADVQHILQRIKMKNGASNG